MATATAGTVYPIEPAWGYAGTAQAGPQMVLPLKSTGAETYAHGDILVAVSTNDGVLAVGNTSASWDVNTVCGVLMGKTTGTAGATMTPATTVDVDLGPGPDEDGKYHTVNVALAAPAVFFQGSLVTDAANDETAVYADNVLTPCGIVEWAAAPTCAALAVGGVGCFGWQYVQPVYDNVAGQFDIGRKGPVGNTNPRLFFTFDASYTVFSTYVDTTTS